MTTTPKSPKSSLTEALAAVRRLPQPRLSMFPILEDVTSVERLLNEMREGGLRGHDVAVVVVTRTFDPAITDEQWRTYVDDVVQAAGCEADERLERFAEDDEDAED